MRRRRLQDDPHPGTDWGSSAVSLKGARGWSTELVHQHTSWITGATRPTDGSVLRPAHRHAVIVGTQREHRWLDLSAVEKTSATRAGEASVASARRVVSTTGSNTTRTNLAGTEPALAWECATSPGTGPVHRPPNERLSGDLHLECAVQDLHQLLRARLRPSLTCWSPAPKVQFHNSTTSGWLGAHHQHPTTVLAPPQHRTLNMADHLQRLRRRRLDQAGNPTPSASLIFNRVPTLGFAEPCSTLIAMTGLLRQR
jgi:hypothetical protein